MPLIWSLAAVPLLILLNAFFVVAEYALVAIRPAQIDLLWKKHRGAANAMARLKAEAAGAIGAIQVCITMTNLMLGWIGEPAMSELLLRALGPLGKLIPPHIFAVGSTVIAFVVVTLLTVVFSELLPKALTLRFVPAAAVLTARPVLLIMRIVRPLVWLMNGMANLVTVPLRLGRVDDMERQTHSTAEIIALTREAASDGVLTEQERSLILNAMALGHRTARHIMVPRLNVACLDLKRSMAENRRVVQERLFSRLPLCDGGMDHVVGVVSVKEFMTAYYGQADSGMLTLIAQPAVFVPEHTPIPKLVETLLDTRSKMVIVVDEYGGVDGIATLDDVVDDLFGVTAARPRGQVGQEPVSSAKSLDPLILPGETPVHEVAEMLGRDGWGEMPDVITIAGLMIAQLGKLPEAGDSLSLDGVQVEAVETDGRAVRKVRVTPAPAATGEENPAADA